MGIHELRIGGFRCNTYMKDSCDGVVSMLIGLTLKQKLVYRRRHENGKILAVFA